MDIFVKIELWLKMSLLDYDLSCDMVLVQLWSDFKDIKSIKKIIEAIFFSFSVGVVYCICLS